MKMVCKFWSCIWMQNFYYIVFILVLLSLKLWILKLMTTIVVCFFDCTSMAMRHLWDLSYRYVIFGDICDFCYPCTKIKHRKNKNDESYFAWKFWWWTWRTWHWQCDSKQQCMWQLHDYYISLCELKVQIVLHPIQHQFITVLFCLCCIGVQIWQHKYWQKFWWTSIIVHNNGRKRYCNIYQTNSFYVALKYNESSQLVQKQKKLMVRLIRLNIKMTLIHLMVWS